jgi:hypothetical protein
MLAMRHAKKSVHLPFCNAHKHYFVWRFLMLVGGLVPAFFLGVAVAVVALLLQENLAAFLGGFLCFTLTFVAWFTLCIIASYWSIYANGCDSEGITLTNISPEFADAVIRENAGSSRRSEQLNYLRDLQNQAHREHEQRSSTGWWGGNVMLWGALALVVVAVAFAIVSLIVYGGVPVIPALAIVFFAGVLGVGRVIMYRWWRD